MERLPLDLALEPTRLLCYGGRRPYLHIVDTRTGSDLPVPSAADRSGQAIDRIRRFDGFLVTEINGVVTLPEDLGEPWLHLGAGTPHPALDPSLFWLLSRARRRAVLMTKEGERKWIVRQAADGILNFTAEVAAGLLLRTDATITLHTPDGRTRDPGVWADLDPFASSSKGVVGMRWAERHRLLRYDLEGALTGGAEVDPRMMWFPFSGAASPSLRHYAGRLRERRAHRSDDERRQLGDGPRPDENFVLADLDTGQVTEIECGWHEARHLMYTTWIRTGDRVFVCAPFDDELLTFSIHDPVLRRVGEDRIRSCPLVELSQEARQTGLPTDVVVVAQARPAVGGGPRRVRATEPAMGKLEQLHADPTLARIAAAVAALALPSIRLGVEHRRPVSSRSRFGGYPDLPVDVPWPYRDEVPLAFLAQFDLAEAASVASVGLPDHGLLSFWFDTRTEFVGGYAPRDDRFWRVLHVDGEVATRVPPDLRLAAFYDPLTVVFREEVTIPAPERVVPPLGLSPSELLRYDMIAAPAATPVHRLRGHPDLIQGGDMDELLERETSAPPRGDDGAGPRSGLEACEEWTLLCQLDTDHGIGLDWTGGRLFFWIPLEDLRRGVFSRVWVVHELD